MSDTECVEKLGICELGGGRGLLTRLQEGWTNWHRAGWNGAAHCGPRTRHGNSHQSYRWAGLFGGAQTRKYTYIYITRGRGRLDARAEAGLLAVINLCH